MYQRSEVYSRYTDPHHYAVESSGAHISIDRRDDCDDCYDGYDCGDCYDDYDDFPLGGMLSDVLDGDSEPYAGYLQHAFDEGYLDVPSDW